MTQSDTSTHELMLNPIHHPRHIRIIVIGAGVAGLCFAYKLQRSFEDFSLTVYEKNESIAGVWFENKYPGVACDFPAHNYTYTFEPDPGFPDVYAEGEDVRQYFVKFAAKYGLAKYIKTGHKVDRAQWNDGEGTWQIHIRDIANERTIQSTCDILISATGVLNKWKWPDIPHLEDFQGPLLHTAGWNESLEIAGKRIGIIGNGSSGQQIVQSLQPIASHLVHFIRQPTWVMGAFGDPQREYTEQELENFKHKPGYLLQVRKHFESIANSYFGNFFKNSPEQTHIRSLVTDAMKRKLECSGLEDLLIPKYGVGCRRITPGVGYLEALTAENTKVVSGDIKGVTAHGIIDSSGTEHLLDILVCATGFDTSFIPRFPLLGINGINLQDEWAKSTKAYLATAVPDFPNYFMFFGPNNTFAGGNYIGAVECQADYMLKYCDRWQTENIHSISPKMEAVDDFLAHVERIVERLVWSDDCRSWYKKGTADKAALTLWPGSGLHFREALSDLRADDYHITYNGNRFAWLGNGFSQTEKDPDADLAYYIREYDDGLFSSRKKRRELLTRTNKMPAEPKSSRDADPSSLA